MRLKVSVINSRDLKDINIQDVEFLDKYDEGLPKIYFKCDKKYEYLFRDQALIFHDKKGKELFRSSKPRMEFRYYESDFGPKPRQNKVKFSASSIEFEKFGLLSKSYLRKILRECCNAKVADPPKISAPERGTLQKWYEYLRFMDIVKSRKFKAVLYKYNRVFRYIYKQIRPKFITNKPISNAPT